MSSADLYVELGTLIETEPDEGNRVRMLNEMLRTTAIHIGGNNAMRTFVHWGHEACKRGAHTPSDYNNQSGSPCERGCGAHVRWYPSID